MRGKALGTHLRASRPFWWSKLFVPSTPGLPARGVGVSTVLRLYVEFVAAAAFRVGVQPLFSHAKTGYKRLQQTWMAYMQGSVLAETEAFITRQREALLQQRQELLNQQQAIQQQLEELEEMLGKFDVFEGKAARPRKQTRRASGSRRGSKRDELLNVIRAGNGLTR